MEQVLNINQWYCVACCSYGNGYALYVDGTRIANTASLIPNFVLPNYNIGYRQSVATANIGFVDDFRLTVGVARYSGTTCPVPTSAFPNY